MSLTASVCLRYQVRRVLDGHDSEKLVIGCILVLCGLSEFNLDINKGMCMGIKYLT